MFEYPGRSSRLQFPFVSRRRRQTGKENDGGGVKGESGEEGGGRRMRCRWGSGWVEVTRGAGVQELSLSGESVVEVLE